MPDEPPLPILATLGLDPEHDLDAVLRYELAGDPWLAIDVRLQSTTWMPYCRQPQTTYGCMPLRGKR